MNATPKLRLTANRKLTLFTLLALPVLLGLGVWQTQRAVEKRSLEAAYIQQQALPPTPLNAATAITLPDHRRVLAQGQFANEHTWLLDNKQRKGRVGYEVVTPFRLLDGSLVLVNRGWLPSSGERRSLPDVPQIAGEQTLFGEWVSASKHPLLDGKSEARDWPRVIMAIEPSTMAQQIGEELAVRYLRLDENSPGALVTDWQPIAVSSAKHAGYAFQWFGMARIPKSYKLGAAHNNNFQ
jgi:surfeit locus 1 family protein